MNTDAGFRHILVNVVVFIIYNVGSLTHFLSRTRYRINLILNI